MTGADYLLSIYDKPLPSKLRSIVPHKRLLKLHCGLYGVPVQRKSGNDFLSSIPKLEEIFIRMYKWTPNPLLLTTGIFTQTKEGMVKVNNRISDWSYSSYLAAKMSWQEKGGTVIELANDGLIAKFNRITLDRLEKAKRDNWMRPLFSQVARVQPFDAAGMNTLITFPGIGPGKAWKIYNACGQDLFQSIRFITDLDAPEYFEIDGISKQGMSKIVKECREYMGFIEDWEIYMLPRNSITLEENNTNGKGKAKKKSQAAKRKAGKAGR